MDELQVGDYLADILRTQRLESEAVTFPAIEATALALEELARRIGVLLVWPVGAAAERIAGASTFLSAGSLRVRDWNAFVPGEDVLLFVVASLTPLPLLVAARQALNMGARSVLACGLYVHGVVGADIRPLTAFHEVAELALARMP